MISTEKATRVCAECRSVLYGRSDQKFCSRHCRNMYNNRSNSTADKLMRKINKALRRNRQILVKLNPEGKCTVHRQKLRSQGFNFDFYTSVYINREGKQYYFCYEYGYLPINDEVFVLVRREPSLP